MQEADRRPVDARIQEMTAQLEHMHQLIVSFQRQEELQQQIIATLMLMLPPAGALPVASMGSGNP